MRGEPQDSRPLTDLLALEEALKRYEETRREVEKLSQRAFQSVRAATGMSQQGLADGLHKTQSYVSQVESGKRTPGMDSLSTFINFTQEALTSGKDSSGYSSEDKEEKQEGSNQ
jgi:ribosome-binding protein aMBF1 (putative translation factor)